MAKRRYRRLEPDMRRQIMRLAAKGWSERRIVDELDSPSMGAVIHVVRPLGGLNRAEFGTSSSGFRLMLEERVEIRIGLEAGRSMRAIAGLLGRAPSTVCREVARSGGRGAYRPMTAAREAWRRARRPKSTKLRANPTLCRYVVADLERLWSPQQIARRLGDRFPGNREMRVSHETIYQSLYVQGRGELRKELARCLRTGRAARKPKGGITRRGKIPEMVMISERPAEAADRAVPGHWEGDLLMGAGNRSAIATLVERSTRYVLLGRLGRKRDPETVRRVLGELIQTLPQHLWRSLTWDQGREMYQHQRFSIDTGIPVYFCDPHSPWQRGSNENTNGLLRQYFPKGTSLSRHTQQHLDAVAVQLNGRPRQTLDWKTPAEKLDELLR
jgi:IS30 family transposase